MAIEQVIGGIEGVAKLTAENKALRRQVAELRTAVAPILDWLGHFRDKGEQVGNLNMELVDKARAALARCGGGGEEVTE